MNCVPLRVCRSCFAYSIWSSVAVQVLVFWPLGEGKCGRAVLVHTRVSSGLDGKRYHEVPRICWINNVLEWSGRSYMELKELLQDSFTWKRLSRDFSASAVERLSWRWHTKWVRERKWGKDPSPKWWYVVRALHWWRGVVVNRLGLINEVNQRRA